MTNSISKLFGSAALAIGLMVANLSAAPITGEVFFTGSADLKLGVANATYSTADNIVFLPNVAIDEVSSNGAYAGLQAATSATFTNFTFGAVGTTGALAVSPLWTFTDAGTGWTYTFDLASISVNAVLGTQRLLEGYGTLNITGAGSPYTATNGYWTLSSSGVQTRVTFSSYATSVPDGGSTLVLLGGVLFGVEMLRRRFLAKK